MVPLAVRCGCVIGTLTARTRSSRIFSELWVMDTPWLNRLSGIHQVILLRGIVSARLQDVHSLDGIHAKERRMPRSATPTPQRIADAAYELFYREGFAHVRVDA